MSPAKLPSKERDQIVQRLTEEPQNAEESYRLMREEYARACERLFTTTPDGTLHFAAKSVRLARKRYVRAIRELAVFTAA